MDDNDYADGRSTRWDAHNARRRDVLIEAAIAAIEAEGPGVGVGRIAERAGVRRPVFYRHFKDRDELDAQIRHRLLAALLQQLVPQLTLSRPPLDTLRAVVGAYVDWVVAHPRLHRFLEAVPPGTPGTASTDETARTDETVTTDETATTDEATGSAGTTGSETADGDRAKTGTEPAASRNEVITLISDYFSEIVDLQAPGARFRVPVAAGLVGFTDAVVSRWVRDRSLPVSASEVSAAELTAFLTASLWMIIDGNMRVAGVVMDPLRPLSHRVWPDVPTRSDPAS